MEKRFKLKLSRVIPSFQSCRSRDPSARPSNPVPSFLRLPPGNPSPMSFHLPAPPSSKPHHSSIKRHMTSAFTSIGCGFRSRSSSAHSLSETDHSKSPPSPPQEFHWEKEDKWHVVAKIYDETPRQKLYTSSVSSNSNKNEDDTVLLPQPSPPPLNAESRKRRHRKKKTTTKIRISTSSADSGLFFSSEGFQEDVINNEETETLVSSSRSLSSDSSFEFNPHLETIRESPFRKKKVNKRSRRRAVFKNGGKSTRKVRRSCSESYSPARLSRFQWLIPCTVEGKVRESFAVVKKSEDPHEDFKMSMMEMILEKQMFEERDLEQLLHCFLSLNSRHHHGVIVQAFSEIWEALFCTKSIAYRVSS